MKIILRLLTIAFAVFAIAQFHLVSGVSVDGFGTAVLVAVVLG
jgi:uncharacterized membrane protein YvlD (DUF360 family)